MQKSKDLRIYVGQPDEYHIYQYDENQKDKNDDENSDNNNEHDTGNSNSENENDKVECDENETKNQENNKEQTNQNKHKIQNQAAQLKQPATIQKTINHKYRNRDTIENNQHRKHTTTIHYTKRQQ